jgi:hypothetical protein
MVAFREQQSPLLLVALVLVGGLCVACFDATLVKATSARADAGESGDDTCEAELSDLEARVAALEASQEALESSLAECLTLAENASVNAAAAQTSAAELRDSIEDGRLWDRLGFLEYQVGVLQIAVEALYD